MAGLVIGYASLDEQAIAEGVRRLAAVLDDLRA
jgi:DNA-binding transcriptional MocR family regulator